ncbi:EamA family transporter RarD [Pseudomonadota bacterium]
MAQGPDTQGPDTKGSSHAAESHDTAAVASQGQGVVLALLATGMWALFPLAFKTVAHIDALEVLAHRSAWAMLFAALFMLAMGRREIFSRAFYAPRLLGFLALSAVAISVNWGVFIWAVAHDRVLESSLGYYINPLVSVALGVVVLREHLSFANWVAIAFAVVGVAVFVWGRGAVPWVPLALAFSWAIYGLVRKVAPVGSLPGLYLETLLLLPLAVGYVVWLAARGVGVFGGAFEDSVLLIVMGLLTALPLLLFARATRILRLASIGLLMYIVPTGQFILAVFVFDEPFTSSHMLAFVLIWSGLAIYGWGAARAGRRAVASSR